MASPRWSEEGEFGIAPGLKAIKSGFINDSKPAAQFSYGSGNSANRNDPIAPPVSGLKPLLNPLAVTGFVPFGIVDSFKGIARRAFSKVCKKVGERVSPTLTDGNSPRSVVQKAFVGLVVTTGFHAAPTFVGEAQLAAHGVPVLSRRALATATTGPARAGKKVVNARCGCFTAIAPANDLPSIRVDGDNLELAETAAYDGFVGGHDEYLSLMSSDWPQHPLGPVASSEYLTRN